MITDFSLPDQISHFYISDRFALLNKFILGANINHITHIDLKNHNLPLYHTYSIRLVIKQKAEGSDSRPSGFPTRKANQDRRQKARGNSIIVSSTPPTVVQPTPPLPHSPYGGTAHSPNSQLPTRRLQQGVKGNG